ncbi:unnamed protein product, partial [Amoebophrya sp. A120]
GLAFLTVAVSLRHPAPLLLTSTKLVPLPCFSYLCLALTSRVAKMLGLPITVRSPVAIPVAFSRGKHYDRNTKGGHSSSSSSSSSAFTSNNGRINKSSSATSTSAASRSLIAVSKDKTATVVDAGSVFLSQISGGSVLVYRVGDSCAPAESNSSSRELRSTPSSVAPAKQSSNVTSTTGQQTIACIDLQCSTSGQRDESRGKKSDDVVIIAVGVCAASATPATSPLEHQCQSAEGNYADGCASEIHVISCCTSSSSSSSKGPENDTKTKSVAKIKPEDFPPSWRGGVFQVKVVPQPSKSTSAATSTKSLLVVGSEEVFDHCRKPPQDAHITGWAVDFDSGLDTNIAAKKMKTTLSASSRLFTVRPPLGASLQLAVTEASVFAYCSDEDFDLCSGGGIEDKFGSVFCWQDALLVPRPGAPFSPVQPKILVRPDMLKRLQSREQVEEAGGDTVAKHKAFSSTSSREERHHANEQDQNSTRIVGVVAVSPPKASRSASSADRLFCLTGSGLLLCCNAGSGQVERYTQVVARKKNSTANHKAGGQAPCPSSVRTGAREELHARPLHEPQSCAYALVRVSSSGPSGASSYLAVGLANKIKLLSEDTLEWKVTVPVSFPQPSTTLPDRTDSATAGCPAIRKLWSFEQDDSKVLLALDDYGTIQTVDWSSAPCSSGRPGTAARINTFHRSTAFSLTDATRGKAIGVSGMLSCYETGVHYHDSGTKLALSSSELSRGADHDALLRESKDDAMDGENRSAELQEKIFFNNCNRLVTAFSCDETANVLCVASYEDPQTESSAERIHLFALDDGQQLQGPELVVRVRSRLSENNEHHVHDFSYGKNTSTTTSPASSVKTNHSRSNTNTPMHQGSNSSSTNHRDSVASLASCASKSSAFSKEKEIAFQKERVQNKIKSQLGLPPPSVKNNNGGKTSRTARVGSSYASAASSSTGRFKKGNKSSDYDHDQSDSCKSGVLPFSPTARNETTLSGSKKSGLVFSRKGEAKRNPSGSHNYETALSVRTWGDTTVLAAASFDPLSTSIEVQMWKIWADESKAYCYNADLLYSSSFPLLTIVAFGVKNYATASSAHQNHPETRKINSRGCKSSTITMSSSEKNAGAVIKSFAVSSEGAAVWMVVDSSSSSSRTSSSASSGAKPKVSSQTHTSAPPPTTLVQFSATSSSKSGTENKVLRCVKRECSSSCSSFGGMAVVPYSSPRGPEVEEHGAAGLLAYARDDMILDHELLVVHDEKALFCYDAKTGEQLAGGRQVVFDGGNIKTFVSSSKTKFAASVTGRRTSSCTSSSLIELLDDNSTTTASVGSRRRRFLYAATAVTTMSTSTKITPPKSKASLAAGGASKTKTKTGGEEAQGAKHHQEYLTSILLFEIVLVFDAEREKSNSTTAQNDRRTSDGARSRDHAALVVPTVTITLLKEFKPVVSASSSATSNYNVLQSLCLFDRRVHEDLYEVAGEPQNLHNLTNSWHKHSAANNLTLLTMGVDGTVFEYGLDDLVSSQETTATYPQEDQDALAATAKNREVLTSSTSSSIRQAANITTPITSTQKAKHDALSWTVNSNASSGSAATSNYFQQSTNRRRSLGRNWGRQTLVGKPVLNSEDLMHIMNMTGGSSYSCASRREEDLLGMTSSCQQQQQNLSVVMEMDQAIDLVNGLRQNCSTSGSKGNSNREQQPGCMTTTASATNPDQIVPTTPAAVQTPHMLVSKQLNFDSASATGKKHKQDDCSFDKSCAGESVEDETPVGGAERSNFSCSRSSASSASSSAGHFYTAGTQRVFEKVELRTVVGSAKATSPNIGLPQKNFVPKKSSASLHKIATGGVLSAAHRAAPPPRLPTPTVHQQNPVLVPSSTTSSSSNSPRLFMPPPRPVGSVSDVHSGDILTKNVVAVAGNDPGFIPMPLHIQNQTDSQSPASNYSNANSPSVTVSSASNVNSLSSQKSPQFYTNLPTTTVSRTTTSKNPISTTARIRATSSSRSPKISVQKMDKNLLRGGGGVHDRNSPVIDHSYANATNSFSSCSGSGGHGSSSSSSSAGMNAAVSSSGSGGSSRALKKNPFLSKNSGNFFSTRDSHNLQLVSPSISEGRDATTRNGGRATATTEDYYSTRAAGENKATSTTTSDTKRSPQPVASLVGADVDGNSLGQKNLHTQTEDASQAATGGFGDHAAHFPGSDSNLIEDSLILSPSPEKEIGLVPDKGSASVKEKTQRFGDERREVATGATSSTKDKFSWLKEKLTDAADALRYLDIAGVLRDGDSDMDAVLQDFLGEAEKVRDSMLLRKKMNKSSRSSSGSSASLSRQEEARKSEQEKSEMKEVDKGTTTEECNTRLRDVSFHSEIEEELFRTAQEQDGVLQKATRILSQFEAEKRSR